MTKTDRHRTALSCVAGAATLAGASVGGAFYVYMLQPVALGMVRIRVTFLLHNVTISSSCTF